MKRLIIVFIICTLNLPDGMATAGDSSSTKSKLATKVIRVATSITQALENRDFQAARTSTEHLLPLIKKDLKQSKKELVALKKESNTDQYQQVSKTYKRKMDIFLSLKHLIEVSPAALRVKSEELDAMVIEYQSIINE